MRIGSSDIMADSDEICCSVSSTHFEREESMARWNRFGVLGIAEHRGERRNCCKGRRTECAGLLSGGSDLLANACGSPGPTGSTA